MSTLFDVAGMVALGGWGLLSVSLFLPDRPRSALAVVTGVLLPASLAFIYVALILAAWGADPDAGFGSISAVRALFADDRLLVAGWLHYLAFDLFAGTWLVGAGRRAGVPRLLLLACLPLAFLFAPAGWLVGIILITIWRKAWPSIY